jgi:N-sulfoglucosamine sulfohydrolase
MGRRQFLTRAGLVGGAIAAQLAQGGEAAAPAPRKRNLVLIVADDLGLQLGCYGDAVAKTPSLDALAAEGTRFINAFCTTASCSASRSVILTGLQNHANGQFGHQHDVHNFHTHRWVKPLPLLLSAAGYRTCLIGKLHVQPVLPPVGSEPAGGYYFQAVLQGGWKGGTQNPYGMAERCREFLAAKDERPFFLYFCPTDPHRAAKGFGNDRGWPGSQEVKSDPAKLSVPPWLPDLPEAHAEWAGYLQAISRLDHGVGHLFQVLKETGHWDDTLMVFISDNGPPWPGAKTTLYEPGMRLPLLVRSPDQPKRGGTCDAMVTWADLTPTLLDLAGAAPPSYKLHGRSFLSLLNPPAGSQPTGGAGWDEVYASHTFHEVTMYYPMRCVRTRRYKLILNLAHPLPFPFASDLWGSETWQAVVKGGARTYGQRSVEAYLRRPRWELYDLQTDPHEVSNLADDPKHAALLAELQAKLKAWQQATKDPWFVKHTYE